MARFSTIDPEALDFIVDDSVYTPATIAKLHKDLRNAAATQLSQEEARYAVDMYYAIQQYRIWSSNRVRALEKADKPVLLFSHLFSSVNTLEDEIKKWMLAYAASSETGRWALSICGIGPVLAAGFLSNLNLERSTNVSKWWAFAGLDPTKTWEKGKLRPWNARLKVLCYKAGESFVKVQNRPQDYYGKLFVQRKALEIERNTRRQFAGQAATILATKNYGHETDAYAAYIDGRLPTAHIHARARRHTIQLFMSHFWSVAYEERYRTIAPNPWILSPQGGHVDRVLIPNHDCPYGANH